MSILTRLFKISRSQYSKQKIQFNHLYTNEQHENCSKTSAFQRMRRIYARYTYIVIPVHMINTVLWIAGCYYIPKSEKIFKVLDKYLGVQKRDSKIGEVTASIVIYKFTSPVRYTVTVVFSLYIIHFLKRHGLIKPIKKCVKK